MTILGDWTVSVYGAQGWVRDEKNDTLEYAERTAEYLAERFGYECHISADIETEFGEVLTASPWDGLVPGGSGLRYEKNGCDLMLASDGTVYYEIKDGHGKWGIWCQSSALSAHVRRLNKILA